MTWVCWVDLELEEGGSGVAAMAALSGVFLAPVLAHDASESGFVTGRKVDCGSGYCSGGRAAALPVAVRAESGDSVGKQAQGGEERAGVVVSRRGLVVSAAALAALALSTESASAVQQNQLAGRIPGLSEPDANGNSFLCIGL